MYGFGKSEELLGSFKKSASSDSPQPVIATKFAPLPWRFTRASVVDACRASLARLGVDQMSLYIQHWPGFGPSMFSNDAYLDGLADCVEQGLTKAVGVSNFNAQRLRKAHAALKARGVVLSSNQVQYSLLYRAPETNGVKAACEELGITLVACACASGCCSPLWLLKFAFAVPPSPLTPPFFADSPLAQGLLTGKYGPGLVKPIGPRSALFTDDRLAKAAPVVALLRESERIKVAAFCAAWALEGGWA